MPCGILPAEKGSFTTPKGRGVWLEKMLTDYIRAAMRRATYEKLEDSSYYGEIPGLEGVWANAQTLEACRDDLQSALEDWIMFSLTNNFPIPPIDGITLAATRVA